jgi:sulfur-oxidizing protein SoxX
MNRMTRNLIIAVGAITISACGADRMSEKGFSLPPGDAENGRAAFLYMQCNECHTVRGDRLPVVDFAVPPYVELGGLVSKVKTYGELLTAVIDPSHKLAAGYAEELVSEDGQSKMPVYNSYMTVEELIDIVMYLQPFYAVVVPPYGHVPHF